MDIAVRAGYQCTGAYQRHADKPAKWIEPVVGSLGAARPHSPISRFIVQSTAQGPNFLFGDQLDGME